MYIFIISLFFTLCIAALKPQSQSAAVAEVEFAFNQLLFDDGNFAGVIPDFVNGIEVDIPGDAQRLLYAQEDQDAQVALLVNFAGDIENFNAIQATNALITTAIQSIILTPTTNNAQLEAEAIASARNSIITSLNDLVNTAFEVVGVGPQGSNIFTPLPLEG